MSPTRKDDKINEADYALRAEARGVEEGHNAIIMPGGWVKVISDTDSTKSYRVCFHGFANGLIWFTCDCISGENRKHLAVPCKHATRAARRLEREKLAVWVDGRWRVPGKESDPTPTLPDNPLEGLPQ